MRTAIPLAFLALAATCLVAGVSLGLFMGARRDFSLGPVHGHLNLMGWVSLALYAFAWRAWPDLGPRWSARLHLALAGGGALVFPFGLAAELSGKGAALLIPASLAWFAGALLFLALVFRRALKGSSHGA
jgi:hypothetical protein